MSFKIQESLNLIAEWMPRFFIILLHIITRLYLYQVQMKSLKDFKWGWIIHNLDIKKGKNFPLFGEKTIRASPPTCTVLYCTVLHLPRASSSGPSKTVRISTLLRSCRNHDAGDSFYRLVYELMEHERQGGQGGQGDKVDRATLNCEKDREARKRQEGRKARGWPRTDRQTDLLLLVCLLPPLPLLSVSPPT